MKRVSQLFQDFKSVDMEIYEIWQNERYITGITNSDKVVSLAKDRSTVSD